MKAQVLNRGYANSCILQVIVVVLKKLYYCEKLPTSAANTVVIAVWRDHTYRILDNRPWMTILDSYLKCIDLKG